MARIDVFDHSQQRKRDHYRYHCEHVRRFKIVLLEELIDGAPGDRGLDTDSLRDGRSCLYVCAVLTSSASPLLTEYRIIAKSMSAIFDNQVGLNSWYCSSRETYCLNSRPVILNWQAV